MPQPLFIGPTRGEVGGIGWDSKSSRFSAKERDALLREFASDLGDGDVGAATQRRAAAARRLAQLEQVQQSYEQRRAEGRRTRRPPARLQQEAEGLRNLIETMDETRARVERQSARERRASESRKARKAAEKANAPQKAAPKKTAPKKTAPKKTAPKKTAGQTEQAAGGTKRRPPRNRETG